MSKNEELRLDHAIRNSRIIVNDEGERYPCALAIFAKNYIGEDIIRFAKSTPKALQEAIRSEAHHRSRMERDCQLDETTTEVERKFTMLLGRSSVETRKLAEKREKECERFKNALVRQFVEAAGVSAMVLQASTSSALQPTNPSANFDNTSSSTSANVPPPANFPPPTNDVAHLSTNINKSPKDVNQALNLPQVTTIALADATTSHADDSDDEATHVQPLPPVELASFKSLSSSTPTRLVFVTGKKSAVGRKGASGKRRGVHAVHCGRSLFLHLVQTLERKRHDVRVYLIDEAYTSQMCPTLDCWKCLIEEEEHECDDDCDEARRTR